MRIFTRARRSLLLSMRLGLAIGGTALVSPAQAQSPPRLWGALEPGRYGVGFRVLHLTDYSRVWSITHDSATGGLRERPRPIRVSVWYPRVPGAGSRMSFSAYVHYRDAGSVEARDANGVLTRRDSLAYLRGDFAGNTLLFRQLLATPTAAVLDATPMRGRFPLVLYAVGWNSLSPDNTVLAEYLASHGFVVATVPQLPSGRASAELAVTAADLQTQQRDLDFALGYLVERIPAVDPLRIALVGYSMGGAIQLLNSGRHANIRGVVGLDPSYLTDRWADFASALDEFVPWRLRVPTLMLRSGSQSVPAPNRSLLSRLAYQHRFLGTVDAATHGDFSDYPRIIAAIGGTYSSPEPLTSGIDAHRAINRCALRFLNVVLAPAPVDISAFDTSACERIAVEHIPAARIPTTAVLMDSLKRNGLERTQRLVSTLGARYVDHMVVNEPEANAAAYAQLRDGETRLALDAFRLITTAYPRSANAYDSMADGYLAVGDSAGFRAALAKVLELADADATLAPSSRAAIVSRARQALGLAKPVR